MPVIFNQSEINYENLGLGVEVKELINFDRVKSDYVKTEMWHLENGAEADFSVKSDALSWVHTLNGSALIQTELGEQEITEDYFLLLPPGLKVKIISLNDVTLFRATVPNAPRFDHEWDPNNMALRCVNWTEEPVLNSEFDARKRIYMLTPQLSGTKVAKGEMILYPPGTEAANHHHEGAEHFQVVLKGNATFFVNEKPYKISAGDTIYIYDNERHYFLNDGEEELSFIEYFVPGFYKTIWSEGANICTWNPTGQNIKGGLPSREIGAHSSAEAHYRTDL